MFVVSAAAAAFILVVVVAIDIRIVDDHGDVIVVSALVVVNFDAVGIVVVPSRQSDVLWRQLL